MTGIATVMLAAYGLIKLELRQGFGFFRFIEIRLIKSASSQSGGTGMSGSRWCGWFTDMDRFDSIKLNVRFWPKMAVCIRQNTERQKVLQTARSLPLAVKPFNRKAGIKKPRPKPGRSGFTSLSSPSEKSGHQGFFRALAE
jgi:hypothetical protein